MAILPSPDIASALQDLSDIIESPAFRDLPIERLTDALLAYIALNGGSSSGPSGGLTQGQVQAAIESAPNLNELEALLATVAAKEQETRDEVIALNPNQSSPWSTLREFTSNTTPAVVNQAPTNPTAPSPNVTNSSADYQILGGLLPNKAGKLQILPKLRVTPGYSARVFPWVYDGSQSTALTPIAVIPRTGTVAFNDSNGVLSGTPKESYDISQYSPNLRAGVRVTLAPVSSVFSLLVSSTSPTVTQVSMSNPGYQGGELVTFGTTGTLPLGLSAYFTGYTASTFTYSGASFLDGEPLRFNHVGLIANAIPPIGISARIQPSGVNPQAGTFTLDGSTTAITFAVGDTIRFRVPPGSTLPTGVANNVTYVIRSVSGPAGSQTFTIAAGDGTSPLIPTTIGVGYFYIFRFAYQPVWMLGTNQISYSQGGPAIPFGTDYNGVNAFVTSSTATTFTSNNHGFVASQAVVLTGTTAPGGLTLGATYYVYGPSITVNTFQLSLTPGGLPYAAYSAGTAVVVGGRSCTVAATAPVPSIFTYTAHGFTNGQALIMGGVTVPGGAVAGNTYYAKNVTANSFELAQIPSGLSCAFTSTGTTVTVTPAGGSPIVVTVAASVQSTCTLVNHYFGATQQFRFMGGSGFTTYTLNSPLYVISNGLATSTFQFSDLLGGAPVVIPGTPTGMQLSANFSGVYPFVLESTQAFVVNPANDSVGFSKTSGGPAIVLTGGSGSHTITPAAAGQILPGSTILGRVSS